MKASGKQPLTQHKPGNPPGELEGPAMSDLEVRLFNDDASIIKIGEGLLARNLLHEEWTHEAHLAACTWIVCNCPDIQPEEDMRSIISAFNESVGVINDDSQGYHETVTQVYIAAVRAHLAEIEADMPLCDVVNALLLSQRGRRDLPLRFYSRELLFSVAARRDFVEPDRASLSEI